MIVSVLIILYFVLKPKSLKGFNPDGFIKPFISYAPSFFTAPDNKLIACEIRKSMSQLTLNMMCLLYNETQYLQDKNNFTNTWETSTRKCTSETNFVTPSDSLKNDKDAVRFVFVRDPFRRFVSMYLNKCVVEKRCFDCETDMRCIAKKTYESFVEIQNNETKAAGIEYVEAHAAPTTWNCKFNEGVENWELLPMDSDLKDRISSAAKLADILRKQGVRDTLVEQIYKDILTTETAHSTHKWTKRLEAEKQVREDPIVREYLHKIYLYDYLLFPFDRSVLDPEYRDINSISYLKKFSK